jgi:hypothetical protein
MKLRRVSMMSSLMALLFGVFSLLEDCNLGTAKRNPGSRSFGRGSPPRMNALGALSGVTTASDIDATIAPPATWRGLQFIGAGTVQRPAGLASGAHERQPQRDL